MANTDGTPSTERLSVLDFGLEVVRRGAGHPLVVLHGMRNIAPESRFGELLSHHAEVIAPSHPGFGASPRPDGFETVYHIVQLYLDLIDIPPYEKVTGLSFGGWPAAEIAVKSCHRLDKLILVDAFGVKISDRETPDILDVFNTHPYMYNPQLKRWLPRISAPTLVVWGTRDGFVNPSYGETHSRLIPGSRFATIAGAGHCPEIEQPDAIAAHVAAFLQT